MKFFGVRKFRNFTVLFLLQIQEFLNFNMIENFGCDFFSSGLGHDLLEAKVKNFFERKTSDGPRYDTYLLYYTGDVYDTGDWALAGNHLHFQMI